jgi:hypothetical protein
VPPTESAINNNTVHTAAKPSAWFELPEALAAATTQARMKATNTSACGKRALVSETEEERTREQCRLR